MLIFFLCLFYLLPRSIFGTIIYEYNLIINGFFL